MPLYLPPLITPVNILSCRATTDLTTGGWSVEQEPDRAPSTCHEKVITKCDVENEGVRLFPIEPGVGKENMLDTFGTHSNFGGSQGIPTVRR